MSDHAPKDTRSMRGMSLVDCLRKLLDKATPGPWTASTWSGRDGEHHRVAYQARGLNKGATFCIAEMKGTEGNDEANAALIAALRNAAPALLVVVEAAQRVVASDPSSGWDGLTEALERLGL